MFSNNDLAPDNQPKKWNPNEPVTGAFKQRPGTWKSTQKVKLCLESTNWHLEINPKSGNQVIESQVPSNNNLALGNQPKKWSTLTLLQGPLNNDQALENLSKKWNPSDTGDLQ